ncbi:hypothetical protein EDD22DRAFT_1029525 [Suillus occidentalis]|nr:hypothetical protein EDD22DRAFT_1029525 [Suillus occidentalis]
MSPPLNSGPRISFGAISTDDCTSVNAVSGFVSRKLRNVLYGQAIPPDDPPPLQLLCGRVSQVRVMLRFGKCSRVWRALEIKRSMYAEMQWENLSEMPQAIRDSEWNAKMDPAVVIVTDGLVIELDFSHGVCIAPVEFTTPSPHTILWLSMLVGFHIPELVVKVQGRCLGSSIDLEVPFLPFVRDVIRSNLRAVTTSSRPSRMADSWQAQQAQIGCQSWFDDLDLTSSLEAQPQPEPDQTTVPGSHDSDPQTAQGYFDVNYSLPHSGWQTLDTRGSGHQGFNPEAFTMSQPISAQAGGSSSGLITPPSPQQWQPVTVATRFGASACTIWRLELDANSPLAASAASACITSSPRDEFRRVANAGWINAQTGIGKVTYVDPLRRGSIRCFYEAIDAQTGVNGKVHIVPSIRCINPPPDSSTSSCTQSEKPYSSSRISSSNIRRSLAIHNTIIARASSGHTGGNWIGGNVRREGAECARGDVEESGYRVEHGEVAVFAIACVAFWCCCRLGELVIHSPNTFDNVKHVSRAILPLTTLTSNNTTGTEGADISVTARDHLTCPLIALLLHLDVNNRIPSHAPLFSFETAIPTNLCVCDLFRVPPSPASAPDIARRPLEHQHLLSGYGDPTNCHVSSTARQGQAAMKLQGQVYYTRDVVAASDRNLAVFESGSASLEVQYPALFDQMKNRGMRSPYIHPSKSLIPLRRKNEHTLPDKFLAPAEDKQGEVAEALDRKSLMLCLPSPIPGCRAGAMDLVVDSEYLTFLRWRSPKTAWVGTLKAVILAAKMLSAVSMWPSRSALLAFVGLPAVLDTMFDGFEASMMLGVLRVVMIRWC